jgi:xylulokinase
MYLGLDLGTSSLKALLIDENQRILGSASAPLTVERPHHGWSEQDPDSWIEATRAALAELGKTHAGELAKVRGIGLSGHMHGATTIDRDGKVIRPCILWNDTRSYKEAAELDADPIFRRLTGNIVFPGFTAPKLKWMAANEPEAFARVVKVLLPKDYLRLWLTGEAISEMSDSAGTSWLDTGKRAWDDSLLAATGLDRSHMPTLVEGTERAGSLRAGVAQDLGLPAGIPIAGGAGDNAASALRHGNGGRQPRLCLARHLGRAVCRQQPVSAQSRQRRACLLSRAAGHMAPDGGDPFGNGFAQLAGRHHLDKALGADFRTR